MSSASDPIPGSEGASQAPAPPQAPLRRRAWRSPSAWITLVLVISLGLTLDLGTKSYFFGPHGLGPVHIDRERIITEGEAYDPLAGFRFERRELLPWRLLDARLVVNHGAVFGLGKDNRFLFIVFTALAIIVGLIYFGRGTGVRHRMAHIAIGLILAGGIGNLVDRWTFAVVRDFLHMLPGWKLPFGWRYPSMFGGGQEIFPWVFNIADVMLLSGMVLLVIHINRIERRRKRLEQEAAEGRGVEAAPVGDE